MAGSNIAHVNPPKKADAVNGLQSCQICKAANVHHGPSNDEHSKYIWLLRCFTLLLSSMNNRGAFTVPDKCTSVQMAEKIKYTLVAGLTCKLTRKACTRGQHTHHQCEQTQITLNPATMHLLECVLHALQNRRLHHLNTPTQLILHSHTFKHIPTFCFFSAPPLMRTTSLNWLLLLQGARLSATMGLLCMFLLRCTGNVLRALEHIASANNTQHSSKYRALFPIAFVEDTRSQLVTSETNPHNCKTVVRQTRVAQRILWWACVA